MKDKIRFLATGDLHSDTSIINNIKKNVDLNSIDFIVLIGDLSERDDDFKDLLGVFKGKRIFMVPGNHEGANSIKALEKSYDVHMIGNSPIKINEDFAIFGTNYISIGPYAIPEEQIFENLVENFESIKDVKCKLHLSHMPPADTELGDASPFFPFIGGSEPVKSFLENFSPDMALVGHIHETSGLEEIVNKTRVVNVGRTFKVLEFDTKKKKLELSV